ncbi:DNA-directed RNA polymerase III largest subunit, putative [Leishmania donovani]|uniref:DNA-directed RNA polymerase subunit n=1 Tax=Leishmania donovani TaxID=5661 RepID=A0A3Q8II66_LEIDO|nr:DNA-directed RNA polymerase III largest subunit, putative [Leishmania donovani]AYU82370.1 DNA-directed RNA polymerase III subunit C1, putative [Leishmania donovani]TPP39951.1 RNA polymerase Rpb1, domain 5 family protein [Leishmania donovani]CBZ37521.1 DNA-directed RNA polymerase III largest subunit, putative [Leishmania donovani]
MSQTATTAAQFVQPLLDKPVEVTSIKYSLLSEDTIHRLSVLPCHRVIGTEKNFGVNDGRLGPSDRLSVCNTCGQRSIECTGHAGHIDLEVPVFHLGYFSAVIRVCRTICKRCSNVLLTREEMEYYLHRLRSTTHEPQQRAAIIKGIQEDAYKTRVCLMCGGLNGTVRRVRPMRIVHEKYLVDLRRGEQANEDPTAFFQEELRSAAMHNSEVGAHKEFVHEFLHPQRVKELFEAIPREQVPLLGLQPGTSPCSLLISTLLVPPVCVRPRGMSTTNHIREDDLTTQYNEILICSDMMSDGTNDAARSVETWELLQTRVARLLDAALPGFPSHLRTVECKSYAQRMKGKQGRFRGNLSGKRVDFSGRSVISPDPNLRIDELAVPLRVARVLTYPQRVFAGNIQLMRRLVRNGPHVHPGALTVYLSKECSRKSLRNARDREAIAARLSIGDVVERHVMNGDYILFNRQPSLHRISLMAHRARVLPFRTFRFNECCCAPYNADFDGDEMNIHVVQTEEARAEAKELMLTSHNIITAKNGEPIIACTQDFLTAAYLVTARDALFDRASFTQMVSHWLGNETQYTLPIPAILKPAELWTGKQLFELILRPTPETQLLLNLEAKARFYSGAGRHDDPAEGYVAFLDSVFLSGRLDKKLLGGGAKDGLFARLYALGGGEQTATCMSRIAQFTARYLQNYGFSLGLGDVSPTPSLNEKKAAVLAVSFDKCDRLISLAKTGRLIPKPGMSVKQSLEAMLNAELSQVRDACGSAAVQALDAKSNAPLIMVNSGSKGSALNTAQMMACVGQQTVSGKRIMNAFQDRALPHFPRFAEDPASRGFVASSFYSGLSPTEFFFHGMAGREGIVDTAVKTAETGYIYRRLSKAMENLSVGYDASVRSVQGSIVQLRYGEDGMDPWLMEGAHGTPLNLDQEWLSNRAAYARFRKHIDNVLSVGGGSGGLAASADPLLQTYRRLYDEWHAVSMLPGELDTFVHHLLHADEATLASCARLMKAEAAIRGAAPSSAAAGLQLLQQLAQQHGSDRLRSDIQAFFRKKRDELVQLRQKLKLPLDAHAPAAAELAAASAKAVRGGEKRKPSPHNGVQPSVKADASASAAAVQAFAESLQAELLPLTKGMLLHFLEASARKVHRKLCEPGTPCGAIAAQSVGEPSTQMTLRTFHFAGVASMSITQGVPRLVEIINANKSIATPVITAPIVLEDEFTSIDLAPASRTQYQAARAVKGLMERVLLKEIAREMVEVVTPRAYYIHIFLNMELIERLLLPIDAAVVCQRLYAAAARPMSPLRHLSEACVDVVSRDSLVVKSYEKDPARVHFNVQHLLTLLPDLVVGGVPGVNRVMIADRSEKLLAEGAELLSVMSLPYVDGVRTTCNHVAVIERALGIEAARETIVREITSILQAYSLNIDIRHIYLLADVMTSRGVVLGITRYGIQKMNNNVLTMASFERTTEHLYNAAMTEREDVNLSVSESIIIGKPIPLGTSSFNILLDKGSIAPPGSNTGRMPSPRRSAHVAATAAAALKSSGKAAVAGKHSKKVEPTPKEVFLRSSFMAYAAAHGAATHRGLRGCFSSRSLSAEGVFRLDLFAL